MPLLSVTVIGVVAAMVAVVMGRWPAGAASGRGVIGAWLGFLAGALVGVAIDVVTSGGTLVAVLGHLAAVGGAVWALGLAGLRAPAVRRERSR